MKGIPGLRVVESALILGGALLLGGSAGGRVAAHVYQRDAAERLEAAIALTQGTAGQASRPDRAPAAAARAPSARRPSADPAPIGRVEIPRLRISAMVAEGTRPRTLDRAVGHVARTALPGERGNVALAGHRDTYFRGLGRIRPRDLIRITTPRGHYSYRVEWTAVVDPDRADLLRPSRRPSLTLVTCYPFHVLGPAPRRFVVRAVQV